LEYFIKNSYLLRAGFQLNPKFLDFSEHFNSAAYHGIYPEGTYFDTDEYFNLYSMIMLCPNLETGHHRVLDSIRFSVQDDIDEAVFDHCYRRGIELQVPFSEQTSQLNEKLQLFMKERSIETDSIDTGDYTNYGFDKSGKLYYFDMHLFSRRYFIQRPV
jgi:hypothetical protein